MNFTAPVISVIVPILNEAPELPELLVSLSRQKDVTFELILCDGGSSDGSQKIASALAADFVFSVKLIRTKRGRGKQMNAGAAAAASDLLLFLHADSRFEENDALLKAVNYCRASTSGSDGFAGRFGLQFRRSQPDRSLSYFFYETKARLPRRDCIRGDQGFLLTRHTFMQAGGFDESLPFLEDIRLVVATPQQIIWQLLPATISTSARRFESEGLLERQILNAIITNNFLAGWDAFFDSLPGLYSNHSHTPGGKLLLYPILEGISRLLEQGSAEWRRFFWQSTGRHVAANAWQLFYWLDVRRTFRSGKNSGDVQTCWLGFYHRRLERFFQGRLASLMAQLAIRVWLRWMLFRGTRQTA